MHTPALIFDAEGCHIQNNCGSKTHSPHHCSLECCQPESRGRGRFDLVSMSIFVTTCRQIGYFTPLWLVSWVCVSVIGIFLLEQALPSCRPVNWRLFSTEHIYFADGFRFALRADDLLSTVYVVSPSRPWSLHFRVSILKMKSRLSFVLIAAAVHVATCHCKCVVMQRSLRFTLGADTLPDLILGSTVTTDWEYIRETAVGAVFSLDIAHA